MRKLPLLFIACFSLFLVGCVGFERKWDQAVSSYQAGQTASPTGPWIGSWETKTNGHKGDLRAIVTPSKKKQGEYQFYYHATWANVFSGAFPVSFPVTKQGNRYQANGEKKLGFFGTFGHRATISRNRFDATYSSNKGDLGTFEMVRPE